MRLIALLLGCSLVSVACSNPNTTAEAPAAPASPAPYNADIGIDEVMVHVMDPAARAFWKGWGEVYDSDGLHDVSARTGEEWKRVEDGAATVVLATNTLMLPAYLRKPEDEWNRWAKEVADLAMKGKQAAEMQDKAAIEEIGGKLDTACDSCHEAFRAE